MITTRIGVLVSGGGTNLQAIIDAIEAGDITQTKIVVVISNKENAFALERAKKHNIEPLFIDPKLFSNRVEYNQKLAEEMENRQVNLICLAGFLLKLEPNFIRQFKGKIMNIHPALLPGFGGEGMYGHYVHEAVLSSGAKISGPTVHFVDEIFDNGPIILQSVVPVKDDDTPETLAKRVLEQEHKIYPEAVKLVTEKKLQIVGKRVKIKNN